MLPDASQMRSGPPSRRVLTDAVEDSVMELLMDGGLEPGAAVNIDALARLLGVSATPVREALGRIAAMGLLERQALRGYRVAPPLTHDELEQLVEARLAIEPVATFRACERADERLVAELRRVHEAQVRAPAGPDFAGYVGYREYLEADRAFHHLLNAGSGNPFLALSFESLNGHVHRFRLFSEHVVDDAPQTLAEHSSILDAVVAGDAARASAHMEAHLRALLHRVTSWAPSGPTSTGEV